MQRQLLSYSVVLLFMTSLFTGCLNDESENENESGKWLDPITEVENCENCTGQDANHQHTNLMQHFLQTD